MTEYNYIALDKTGKQQKGSLVAETERFALEQLRSEGLYPTQLRKSTLLTKDLDLHIGSKVSTRDISVFCRQFASMLAAGVTILEALSMLEQQSENKHLVEALGDVRQDIMKGETLAVAMRRQAEVFPELMLNMVAAGEEAGKLEMTFSRMADQTVSWNKGKASATIDQVLLRSTANDQMDAEGNPVLRYHFSLQGKADALYQVRLYVDSNGNGSFEKEECSSEPIITDTTEGALNGTTANGTLLAGHSYTVERALPATQAGMLPWKLEVSAVDATSDRDSAIGYTRIVNYGQKETIHVLQMNLTADMKTDATSEIRFADRTTEVGAKFAAYLENVEDFDVDIDYRSNSWFMNNYEGKPEEWASDLQKYDMLILGFSDVSSFYRSGRFLIWFSEVCRIRQECDPGA